MTQRGGKLAKEGKTLAHKHFERSLLEIETLKPNLRLDPNEDRFNWDKPAQRYTNMVTQAMWLGYTIAQAEHRDHARGNFVIAHADEKTGRPVFTETPFVHNNYRRARVELKRLATRYRGRRFILYNSLQMEKCDPTDPREVGPNSIATGFVDDNGVKIYVGDTLESINAYEVLVCQNPTDKQFYGKLVCDSSNTCENIPYAINEGRGYLIVTQAPVEQPSFTPCPSVVQLDNNELS